MSTRRQVVDMNQHGQLSPCDRCQKRSLFLDIYSQPFNLRVVKNTQHYKTLLGSLLSVFTLTVVISFVGYKLQALLNF